ncbi:MAG: hypothetical protein ACK5LN_05905, partial [Propioniciclava sp.]
MRLRVRPPSLGLAWSAYTKVHDRLLQPLIAADQPPAPTQLRNALNIIDRHVHNHPNTARLGTAA